MSARDKLRWEQTLRSAMEAIISLDLSGRVIAWSHQAETYFGWQPQEVIGTPIMELLFAGEPDNALAQGWNEIAEGDCHGPVRRIFRNVPARHRLGHAIILEMVIARLEDHCAAEVVMFMRDVTEIRSSEDASRIAAVVFQSMEGMVVMDALQRILRVNKAFTDITGYDPNDAVGKQSAMFRPGHQNEEAYREMRRCLAESKFWQGQVWDRRKNGERYCAWLRVTAVAGQDQEIANYVAAFVDYTEQHVAAQRIDYLGFHDSLTELPNRRYFSDRLGKAMSAGRRRRQHCAVLLLDIDDFKSVNDTLGHRVGDDLLVQIGRRLHSNLHAEDSVARLGGDEFAVILEGIDGDLVEVATKVSAVGERIAAALAEGFHIADLAIDLTVSIGISIGDCNSTRPEALLKEADIALYKAKSEGPSCIRFFDGRHQIELESRFGLIKSMRQGFPDQFSLHYQLQVNGNLEPVAAEALLRWTHSTGAPVSPAVFIPIAEESGFIVQLGTWVLQQACRQLRVWSCMEATRDLALSVNVSARQFFSASFVPTVLQALEDNGANPNLLKLELTEGLMLDHISDASEKMSLLRRHGVRFSLDDFGTGYSSLAYLKGLPFEQLKIDRAFVRDLQTNGNDLAIASAVVALGRALGLQVVGEGVENEHQYAILKSLGCNYYQGYYFSRPTTAERMLEEISGKAQVLEPVQT